MDLPAVITPALLAYLKDTYKLHWEGLHGWSHWVRVWENGQRLATLNGADQAVVAMFAFTHDMARLSDGSDREHGPRAAERIRAELLGTYIQLAPPALKQLLTAVALHTRGLQEADITIQTCWDSDRLDLGRAGIQPDPKRMCTQEARDPAILAWAYRRSLDWRGER
jgi:uncharacterized protein